jgi:hypothetical protein
MFVGGAVEPSSGRVQRRLITAVGPVVVMTYVMRESVTVSIAERSFTHPGER